MNKARVESFSDGVFAFAITLLVLGFQVPNLDSADDPSLVKALVGQLPQLIPYVTSFATIGIIWLNHHTMFHEVDHVERGTLVLNLLLLLVVSFIPYPTAVLGRYGPLRSSGVLYGVVLTILGLTYTMLWRHIASRRLSKDADDSGRLRAKMLRNLLGTIGYPLGTVIAFFRPRVAVLIYLAVAVYYLFPERPPGSRGTAPATLWQSRRREKRTCWTLSAILEKKFEACRSRWRSFDLTVERVLESRISVWETQEEEPMQAHTQTVPVSQKVLWAGRIVSALPVLMLLFSGTLKVMKLDPVVQGFARYGYPERLILLIGFLEIASAVLYMIPRTTVLGAILMTGYLGGATATNVRIGDPSFVVTVILGVLVWLGLYLRDQRLRPLVPLRS
jgi:uncharacterized membrane protein